MSSMTYGFSAVCCSSVYAVLTRSFLPGFGESIAIRVTASVSAMFGKIDVVCLLSIRFVPPDNSSYIGADMSSFRKDFPYE